MLTRHNPRSETGGSGTGRRPGSGPCRPGVARFTALALLGWATLCAGGLLAASPPLEPGEADSASIRLLPVERPLLTGSVTFRAEVGGPVAEVRFALDGETRVQRRTPPYEATLFVGHLPTQRRLVATALDSDGQVLATDALVLNPRPAVLRVEFLTPGTGAAASPSGRVAAILDLNAPPGRVIERLDLFRDEELLETVPRPDARVRRKIAVSGSTRFLRALITTDDGNTAEDVALINAPPTIDELEVRYVELYVRARERRGSRPVLDLQADDLQVLEDGRPQVIRRFSPVEDLPLHLVVLFDVSASMRARLDDSVDAARTFFVEALRPVDRATLVAFNDRVHPLVEHSSSTSVLSNALDTLEAERGTSLHDAVLYGLYQLEGLTGQRAAVLFSDGRDESSRARFEDMIEYAQRAGVPVYAVRLETERPGRRSREDLRALASATGGQAFFVDETEDLPAVYEQILGELRTRYLVTFQSDQTDGSKRFRRLELRTNRRGITVEARPGYLP